MGAIGTSSGALQRAFDQWARNPVMIRKASIGGNAISALYTEFNQRQDNERAALLEQYVHGHRVTRTIYRGVENLSNADYARYTTVGETIDQNGLSSWSLDRGIAVGHAQLGKSILFIQQGSSSARELGNMAGTGTEKEVIMSANARQVITRVEKRGSTTLVYTTDKRR